MYYHLLHTHAALQAPSASYPPNLHQNHILQEIGRVLDFKISKSFDYATKINSFLILSNDLNVIQNLILNYNNKSLISQDENFIKFLEFIPNKTTYFEIINNADNEDTKDFPYWFSNYELKGNSNFKSIYTTPSFDLKKNKNLNLKFSKKFKNEIIVNPTFINNYKSGEKNIIFQDSNFNLILLGLNQEIILFNPKKNPSARRGFFQYYSKNLGDSCVISTI